MTCGFRQLREKRCLALASAFLLCCSTVAQTVRTSRAPGVTFSKYHTYRWVVIKGVHADPSVDAQIKQSIDSQLAAKGLTKADDTADLNVDYQSDPSLMGQRLPQHKKVTIEVGTLVIDMYDVAAKQLVWTGRAHKTLDPNTSREDRQRNLDKAAKKLLADFPPK